MQGRAFISIPCHMPSFLFDSHSTEASNTSATKDQFWDACSLKQLLSQKLLNQQVIVVSNREPYLHEHIDDRIDIIQPPGGLVTALEPVLRACGGTWVAHGSGSADAECVDDSSACAMPPGIGDYRLRRVWLTALEQAGYLDGFSNQGLWPLCHLANQPAIFNAEEWRTYQRVNNRFAEAVVEEACQVDPIILVQDYHLALVPQIVRAKLPKATVVTFWHIPWPNPKTLSACPWNRELLAGLMGSSIIGLQTDVDRRNFLASVERMPNVDVDHAASTVNHGNCSSFVHTYPISIDWPEQKDPPIEEEQFPNLAAINQSSVPKCWPMRAGGKLMVGVDRFDYTKGFLQRMKALEHLLATHTDWIGKVSLVQVAAPTRGAVSAYAHFQAQVISEVNRINNRFARCGSVENYRPIYLLNRHHDHDQVTQLYRRADVCIVSSLHDGMNLVAKEFVAARNDEVGVLVLSKFAGASAELQESLLINPHNIEQTANSYLKALIMPACEQKARMQAMRATVRKANIFSWAASILLDVSILRAKTTFDVRATPTCAPKVVRLNDLQRAVA